MRAAFVLGVGGMKNHNSAYYAAVLAEGLSAEELPLNDRTDNWWYWFWCYIGLAEAKRIKEKSL